MNRIIKVLSFVFVFAFIIICGDNVIEASNIFDDSCTDGKYSYVVAPADGKTQLVRYDSETGESEVIYTPGQIKYIGKVFVCGDKLIIEGNQYETATFGGYSGFKQSIHKIYSMNKDGSSVKEITKGSDMIYHKGKIYYIKPIMMKLDGEKGSLYGQVYKMNPDGSGKKLVYKKKKVSALSTDGKYLYVLKYNEYYSIRDYYRITFKGKKEKKVDYIVYKNKNYTFYAMEFNAYTDGSLGLDYIKVCNKKGKTAKKIKADYISVYNNEIYYSASKANVATVYKLNAKTLKSTKLYTYKTDYVDDSSYARCNMQINKNGMILFLGGMFKEDGKEYDMRCRCVNKNGKETDISKWFVS
jgi:hypothetical protein